MNPWKEILHSQQERSIHQAALLEWGLPHGTFVELFVSYGPLPMPVGWWPSPKGGTETGATKVPIWAPAWMVLLIRGVPRYWRGTQGRHSKMQGLSKMGQILRTRQYCFQQLTWPNSCNISIDCSSMPCWGFPSSGSGVWQRAQLSFQPALVQVPDIPHIGWMTVGNLLNHVSHSLYLSSKMKAIKVNIGIQSNDRWLSYFILLSAYYFHL